MYGKYKKHKKMKGYKKGYKKGKAQIEKSIEYLTGQKYSKGI